MEEVITMGQVGEEEGEGIGVVGMEMRVHMMMDIEFRVEIDNIMIEEDIILEAIMEEGVMVEGMVVHLIMVMKINTPRCNIVDYIHPP